MIKFLELNDYENAVLNKADRFTLWSKNFKKELRVLHAFINGNDNPEIAGIDATIFDTRRNLIKYIEPLRQKINNKIMEKK